MNTDNPAPQDSTKTAVPGSLERSVSRTCCQFKRVRYRTDYAASDARAYTEIHAKGCLARSAANEKVSDGGPLTHD